ncbi:MAG: alpha/beta hydrolase [Candidatus Rokuibacteriota bacterium]|nr:MAG: alpha/beta hydrolase [Candidatus Rokubacteria bacterium]
MIRASSLLEFGMHTDRIVVLQGQRFHYTEWGASTAPALLMLHGVTGHARTWDEEAGALASRYRVLALDQRGHGDSDPAPDADYTVAAMAGDLTAFADTLGLARASIVGLSMGGRVAIAWAGLASHLVDRLVVVDIGPDISQVGLRRVGALMAQAPELFPSLEAAIAFQRATNPNYTEPMLHHRVQHGTRPAPGGLTWKYDRGLRDAVRSGRWRDPIDLWPLWRAITCPILLVRGADSDVLSAETAKRMLDENPNARLAEVAGAGHTVPGDQPAMFQSLLHDFLTP